MNPNSHIPYFHLHVPYHTPTVLAEVPDEPWLTRYLLPDLHMNPPTLQTNLLGEGRLFLCQDVRHPEWADYVGVFNARAHRKYQIDGFCWDRVPGAFERQHGFKTVLCLWPTANGRGDDWLAYSDIIHPGMGRLVAHACNHAGVELVRTRPSLWANDFICHWEVWEQWLTFWRASFHYLYGRFGPDPPFRCSDQYADRKPALLYERLTTAYFASREDLEVVRLVCE